MRERGCKGVLSRPRNPPRGCFDFHPGYPKMISARGRTPSMLGPVGNCRRPVSRGHRGPSGTRSVCGSQEPLGFGGARSAALRTPCLGSPCPAGSPGGPLGAEVEVKSVGGSRQRVGRYFPRRGLSSARTWVMRASDVGGCGCGGWTRLLVAPGSWDSFPSILGGKGRTDPKP